jgi:hypothetical protein
MIKQWLCLLLVSAFMLQSLAAGSDLHDAGHGSVDHSMVSVDHAHALDDADHAMADCDVHQHGHCCHGHFSAALNSHAFDVSASNNSSLTDYLFFVPSSPASELLRPPTV